MKAGGKVIVSKHLTGEVRKLTLQEIRRVLLGKDLEYKKQLVLKLAGTILPRLNEHSGEDGGPMNLTLKIVSGSYQEKVLKEKGLI